MSRDRRSLNPIIRSALIFHLLLSSCVADGNQATRQQLVISPSPVPTERIIQPTIIKYPTAVPTELATNIPSILPKTSLNCPDNKVVPLQELGLSPSTRVILHDDKWQGVWTISGENPEPKRITNLHPDARISSIGISPNGKWFLYSVFREKQDGVAFYDFWISSITGEQQWIAISNAEGNVHWADNETVEVWKYWSRGSCYEKPSELGQNKIRVFHSKATTICHIRRRPASVRGEH